VAKHCFLFKAILYYNNYSQDPSESASKQNSNMSLHQNEPKHRCFLGTTKEHCKILVIRTPQINDKSQIKEEKNAKYSPMCKQVGEWCLARYGTNTKGSRQETPVTKLFKIRGTLSIKIKIKMKELHAQKRWGCFQ
jgi:hypothetical protein